MGIKTAQTTITGKETPGKSDRPEEALAQFYRAFNGRDLDLMEKNWDTSDEVAMDNPLGGIVRGWPEIRSVYEKIFSGIIRVNVEFFDYTIHVSEDTFYAVGRERGFLESENASLELAIRTSRVFRWVDGRWRQAHHHGSIDDPALLAEYQAAAG